jgi:hypothetical protein
MERPSIDVLREGARRDAESTNLRIVAADVGMSARGLLKFLDGSAPRAATLRKLRDWYVRRAASQGEVTLDTALAALTVLLDGIPVDEMRDCTTRLLEAVRENHRETGTKEPDWVRKLIA